MPDNALQSTIADRVAVSIDPTQKAPSAATYAIPDNQNGVVVRIDRATSQDGSTLSSKDTHVAVAVFASYDSGATWEHVGTITTNGGITTGKEGEVSYSQIPATLRPGNGRQLRVHHAILCGPATTLRSTVSVN